MLLPVILFSAWNKTSVGREVDLLPSTLTAFKRAICLYEVRSRNQRYWPMNFDSQHCTKRLLGAVFSKYTLLNHRLLKDLLTSSKSLAQIVDYENALRWVQAGQDISAD